MHVLLHIHTQIPHVCAGAMVIGKKIYSDVNHGSHEPWMTVAGEGEGLCKTHSNRLTDVREHNCMFGSIWRGMGSEPEWKWKALKRKTSQRPGKQQRRYTGKTLVWNLRLYFRVQFTDNIKGENAVSLERELLLSAPHGCHGQFLVIQTRAGENLSHQSWNLPFDKAISIGFLKAKYFGYQGFTDKISCTLVLPQVKQKLLYHYLSFLTRTEDVKGSSEGINF